MLPRDKSIGNLFTGWMVSGIEMARVRSWLLCGTAGTCHCDVKGGGQEFTLKAQSTNAQCRGGLTRSSDEESVMDLEPHVIWELFSTPSNGCEYSKEIRW